MKSLLKFTLLSALIISGKLAKQSASASVAQTAKTNVSPDTSVVLVHQLTVAVPVQPIRQQAQPQQSGTGLLAEMF